MKKKLLIAAGALVALLVIGVVVIAFSLGSIVKAGVNTVGPRVTGTKVELASASLSPVSGSGTLKGLFVGNPAGWQSDKAFYLGQIHVSLQPASLIGDHIVIDEITIDQPEFVYETKLVKSNIKDLLANIQSFTGSSDDKSTESGGSAKKIEIHKFVLKNGNVTVGVGPAAFTVPLPALTLTDLGTKEGGLPPAKIAVQVLTQVLSQVVEAVATHAGEAIKNGDMKGAAQKAGDALKNLFGSKPGS